MLSNSPAHLLVVDDDAVIVAVFRRICAGLSVRLTVATTYREGLAVLDRERPALVISDYRLPDGDGLSLVEKARERYPGLHCVLHTGEAVHRTAYGLDVPVLSKPCSVDELQAVVGTVLKSAQGSGAHGPVEVQ